MNVFQSEVIGNQIPPDSIVHSGRFHDHLATQSNDEGGSAKYWRGVLVNKHDAIAKLSSTTKLYQH